MALPFLYDRTISFFRVVLYNISNIQQSIAHVVGPHQRLAKIHSAHRILNSPSSYS